MTRSFILVASVVACSPADRVRTFGKPRWVVPVAETIYRQEPVMALDPLGDVILAGTDSAANAIWIGKRSGDDGSPLWSVRFVAATGSIAMPHVATDRDGDVLVTGSYSGSATFGSVIMSAVPETAFVAKLSSNGQVIWVSDMAPNMATCGYALAVGFDDQIYATGNCGDGALVFNGKSIPCQGAFIAAFAPDGAKRWATTYPGDVLSAFDLTATSDGHLVFADTLRVSSAFGSEWLSAGMVAARMKSSGELEWARSVASGSHEAAVADNVGNVVATAAGGPATISMIDPTGTVLWQVQSNLQQVDLHAISVLPDGTIVAAGMRAFEAYGPDGAWLDGHRYASEGTTEGTVTALAAMPSGALAFTGNTPQTYDFGAGVVSGGFVGVLDPQ